MKIILGSQSPRRKQLLHDAGFDFEIRVIETDESYPRNLDVKKVAEHIAKNKAAAFADTLLPDELLITADTIVIRENKIYGKPKNEQDAFEMLQTLNGNMHEVISGVCIKTNNSEEIFSECTQVFFRQLSADDLKYYVKHYKPYDKAGAYAIQEWIGYVGIEKINGCFYNVMGLPIGELRIRLGKYFN